MDAPENLRVAVIGSGVSGLSAAWFATQAGARVVLYESDERLGGHADTHLVVDGTQELAIDTGFIVHNRHTYPVLCRLFDELGVQTQPSKMSLSVHDEATGLEWAGAKGRRGLFPEPRRLFDVGHWRMLVEIPRFHRAARRLLEAPSEAGDPTLDEFLDRHRFSDRLRRHFVRALVAAVWSCDPEIAGRYPARHLFAFLANHGMLAVFGSPRWRTVVGGSRDYVLRIAKELPDIRLSTAVTGVEEHAAGVTVRDAGGGEERFDHVIIATHPRQALAMLSAPSPAQREVLAAMPYSPNPALLHTDERLLPRADGARAAWNLRLPESPDGRVTVTYDMTRLQRLHTDTRFLVTLGGDDLVDPATIIARMDYEHPVYTAETVAAQRRLPEIDTDRVVFAGAYHGWGFHEDGARSGAEAVRRLGLADPRAGSPAGRAPEVYRTRVGHRRTQPFTRTFEQRSSTWVVDIDEQAARQEREPLWRRVTVGTIEARDHLGDPTATLRQNLAAFLARHGIELGDASVRLMAHPRAFGFCFNPISVWWCTRRDGTPLATVVEVHNTYGDRHAYLFDGGTEAERRVDKAMYVSPFHGVAGSYRVTAPPPTDALDVRVELDLPEGATFQASIRGRRTRGLRWRAALAGPADRLAITAHGLALWIRRLPIQPRPTHHQEGVR
ncbi:FAD-dependent oxidoreductase [Aeromicrobium sp. Marseille-Q0843]|uniref:FAD-dependent oxidoreductase n=1 Tax=Aeromicrobium phoceense TaxID=2754045 RepID=A0A838XH23_9ACTN|nr:FAD-dependent oxidoreductase [Aeromicrobium phoceense]MBA4609885.1 FAD-dependent oxidoreductase [Aeromicrobium phoceense]